MEKTRTFGRQPTLGEMKEYYARDDVLSFLYDECQMRNIDFAFRQQRWPINPASKAHLKEIIEQEIAEKIERAYMNSAHPLDSIRLAKFDYLSFHSRTSITADGEEIGFDTIFEADMQGWRRSFEDLVGVVKMLDDYGVCYRIKYSGVRSLHFMIPFESFPKEFNGKSVVNQRKEIQQKLRRHFQRHCGMQKAHRGQVLRLAYSLNEDNGLVSMPILSEELNSFRPWEANIYNVSINKPWHGDVPSDASKNMENFLQDVYKDEEANKERTMWISYGLEIAPKDRSDYANSQNEVSLEKLGAQLKSKNVADRVEAAWNLMITQEAVPLPILEEGLTDTSADVRWYMTEALQKQLDERSVSLAGERLLDNDQLVRISAIDAFVLAGADSSSAMLESIAGNISTLSEGQLHDLIYAISKIDLESKLKDSSLLSRSDAGLIGLIKETDGDKVFGNPALLVQKSNATIEAVFESAFASDAKLRELASALLRHWIARYGLRSESSMYTFLGWLIDFPMESETRIKTLIEMLEASRKGKITPLLTCIVLCYPGDAFPLLMERFWNISDIRELGRYRRIIHALCRMGTQFGQALLKRLLNGDVHRQKLALAGLEKFADALNNPKYRQVSTAELAMSARIDEGLMPPPEKYRDTIILDDIVKQVAELLNHSDAAIRGSSIRILGLMQANACLDKIKECMKHTEISTRVAAISALGAIGDIDSVSIEILLDILHSGESSERLAAVETLGRLQVEEAQDILMQLISDDEPKIRQAIVVALGAMKSESAQAKLQEIARSNDKRVARAAAKALYANRKRPKPSETTRKRLEKVRGEAAPVLDVAPEIALRMLPEIRPYEHREITRLIAQVCRDYSVTRRALIYQGLMERSNGIYTFTEWGKTVWRVERFVVEHYLRKEENAGSIGIS